MSEITRDKLTRGVKPVVPTAFGSGPGKTALAGIADDLANSEVDENNLLSQHGKFYVHVGIPYLDSELISYHDSLSPGGTGGYCVPFLLPPIQDYWEDQHQQEPTIILDSLSVGFDQRSEGCVIRGMWQDATVGLSKGYHEGEFSFTNLEKLGVEIVIHEKTPLINQSENTALNTRLGATASRFNYQPNFRAEGVLYQIPLADVIFIGGGRANPVLLSGINKKLSPYRSYMLEIRFPNMATSGVAPHDDFALPSFNVSLGFKSPLVSTPWREGGANIPQNAPSVTTQKQGHSISIATPPHGSIMYADNPNGIALAMADIDQVYRKKLRGGLDRDANPPGPEALKTDSCYDVITVPLYQLPFNGMIKATGVASQGAASGTSGNFFGAPTQLPYYSADNAAVESRRIIPIPYPMEIHHVIAHMSLQKSIVSRSDANPSIRHKIGVAMGTGIRGDQANYTQVAYADIIPKWGGANLPSELLDRWIYPQYPAMVYSDTVYNGGTLSNAKNISWESYGIPLVYVVGSEGVGYVTQGTPIFAAQATGGASGKINYATGKPRTQISSGVGGAHVLIDSRTHGAEQWLEIRWQMIADDAYTEGAAGFSNLTSSSPIVGYGGNYVTIIGKKFLTN